jgi:hypothetical protein
MLNRQREKGLFMIRMTRFAALAASAVLATSLAACGGDDNGGDVGAFCDKAAELDQFDLSQIDPTDDDGTSALTARFDELASLAPSDIRGDFDTMTEVLTVLGDVDVSDPGSVEALEDLDQAEFQAAADRLGEYVASECGIS